MSGAAAVAIRVDPSPDAEEFGALWQAAWGTPWTGDTGAIWSCSLAHLGAYAGDRLVGYVNIAWDGGVHAFLLDATVHPEFQRRGIGRALVRDAAELARQRGARWLHVDYEPHLEEFYRGCGFRPTASGLIRLEG